MTQSERKRTLGLAPAKSANGISNHLIDPDIYQIPTDERLAATRTMRMYSPTEYIQARQTLPGRR